MEMYILEMELRLTFSFLLSDFVSKSNACMVMQLPCGDCLKSKDSGL
jgi:hypothetical protein